MKVKLFEEYNSLYKEIPKSNFLMKLGSDIDLPSKHIGLIKDICNDNDAEFIPSPGSKVYAVKSLLSKIKIYFFQIDDEWILVHVEHSADDYYYKCDTIDGLIKLIKDKLSE